MLIDRLQVRFVKFDAEHPEVYKKLVELALSYHNRGVRRGIAHLWEVLRYTIWINHDEDFMLNNDFRSRYARLLMEREPLLRGYFETRRLRSMLHDDHVPPIRQEAPWR